MKVTYLWLKDFVDISIPPQELAHALTMAGLEVTSLEKRGSDTVFEIEVTSNRPDWLSIVGIAREVAAITGRKLKSGSRFSVGGSRAIAGHRIPKTEHLYLEIENKKDCPLYSAKIMKNISAGPSPQWLRERLESVGTRSINSIVDITNYILLEWGQPLHAFDLDKFNSPEHKIVVRRARNGETLITLDGTKRELNEHILIIAAGNESAIGKPVAIAGVMGGKDTEVSGQTKNILLEAAVFNPAVVRRGRQLLSIQSESSYRFERGVNACVLEDIACRAQGLLQSLAGGKPLVSKASAVFKKKSTVVVLDPQHVNSMLGVVVPAAKMAGILQRLGFQAKGMAKGSLSVTVPSFRQDVRTETDLAEEIARIYGYDNIPTTLPCVTAEMISDERQRTTRFIKQVLLALGSYEVITYSLVDKGLAEDFKDPETEIVEIQNPLSREQSVLQTSLVPGLCSSVAYNLNQKQGYINVFEIADVFSRADGLLKEERKLAIALCGMRTVWTASGPVADKAHFLHLKGMTEALFERLGIKTYRLIADSLDGRIGVFIGEAKVGEMLQVKESFLDSLGIKNNEVFVAEFSLDTILLHTQLHKRFESLPVFPSIQRDMSLVLKEEISVQRLIQAIQDQAGPLLKEIKIADYYKGAQIPKGFIGLTISCLYRLDDRTLTESEISPLHNAAIAAIVNSFGATLR